MFTFILKMKIITILIFLTLAPILFSSCSSSNKELIELNKSINCALTGKTIEKYFISSEGRLKNNIITDTKISFRKKEIFETPYFYNIKDGDQIMIARVISCDNRIYIISINFDVLNHAKEIFIFNFLSKNKGYREYNSITKKWVVNYNEFTLQPINQSP